MHEPTEAKTPVVCVVFLFTSLCEQNTVEGSICSPKHTLNELPSLLAKLCSLGVFGFINRNVPWSCFTAF